MADMDVRRKTLYLLFILLGDAFNIRTYNVYAGRVPPHGNATILDDAVKDLAQPTTPTDGTLIDMTISRNKVTSSDIIISDHVDPGEQGIKSDVVIYQYPTEVAENVSSWNDSYGEIVVSADEDEEVQRILDLELWKDNRYLLNVLKSALDEYGVKDMLVTGHDCNTTDTKSLLSSIRKIPIVHEMLDFIMLLAFIANDCDDQGLDLMDDLTASLDDPDEVLDILIEFIEAFADADNDSILQNDALTEPEITTTVMNIPTTTEDILGSANGTNETDLLLTEIQTLVNEVRILEALQHETAEQPRLCNWIFDNNTFCHPLDNDSISQITYDTIFEAQRACETLKDVCVGVIDDVDNEAFYTTSQCTDMGFMGIIKTVMWWKDCSSLNHSPGFTSRQKRSASKNHGGVRVAYVYKDRDYMGNETLVEGAVEHLNHDFDNEISSMSCEGCTIVVFQNKGFSGLQVAFENRTPYVGDIFDDAISSLVVLPFSIQTLCYTLYEQSYHRDKGRIYCGDQKSIDLKRVRSIKVLCDDCSVILYKGSYDVHTSFKAFDGSVSDVGEYWQEITSVQVRPWHYEGYENHVNDLVTFYKHKNFEGDFYHIQGLHNQIKQGMNDEFSSFKCRNSTCNVLVFEDKDMGGSSLLLQGSQANLAEKSFNDKISSVVVLSFEICVTVYEHSSFRGQSQRFCKDIDSLRSLKFEDKISSLSVECDHCSVIIYQHRYFTGKFKAFKGKVSYLGAQWNDEASSLQIRPYILENHEGCNADKGEQKAYNVIQYIPLFSLFYSLFSSIYYGAVGCDSVAKSRATDMGIDLAFEIAAVIVTVATAGTATGSVYAIKTAAKAGFKAGVTAFKKFVVSSVKQGIKKLSKTSIKGIAKKIVVNPAKKSVSALKVIKKLPSAIKKFPSSIKKTVQKVSKGFSKVKDTGMKETIKDGISKVGTKLKTTFDDIAENAQKKIDDVSPNKKGMSRVRCRRMNNGCAVPHSKRVKTNTINQDYKEMLVRKRADLSAHEEAFKSYKNVPDTVPLEFEEFVALRRWTTPRYEKLNQYMRGQLKERSQDFIDAELEVSVLKKALNKCPKVPERDFVRWEPMWKNGGDSFESFYKKGKDFTSDSFMATSLNMDLDPAKLPGLKNQPKLGKLTVHTRSGVSLDPYAVKRAGKQAEVLIPPGTRFKITNVVNGPRNSKGIEIIEVTITEIA